MRYGTCAKSNGSKDINQNRGIPERKFMFSYSPTISKALSLTLISQSCRFIIVIFARFLQTLKHRLKIFWVFDMLFSENIHSVKFLLIRVNIIDRLFLLSENVERNGILRTKFEKHIYQDLSKQLTRSCNKNSTKNQLWYIESGVFFTSMLCKFEGFSPKSLIGTQQIVEIVE